MSTVDLARLQFASTSIYHFLFVPLTIGLALVTAFLQTRWHRTDEPEYLRLTRFFGTLLVINVAVGVVTGLVQEFQFGMNWSGYSRFVGDVFGAPLAMEGLAAFFLESTFLALWVFGWNRLSSSGAANDLTAQSTASASYALTVMTVVLVVVLPIVLLYQGWTYHVFRGRLRGPRVGEDEAVPGIPSPRSGAARTAEGTR